MNHSLSILYAVMESAPYGLLVTNKQGCVLCYNQPYVDMWSIPREFLAHESHQALMQYCSGKLRDPGQFLRSTEEIYATWAPEIFDILEFIDGRVFERYTKARTLEGPNSVLVWSFKDITERRQAEAYKAQLAAMVESSDDAIIVEDLNGIITSWNAGAERIFGHQASEITGSSILALIPPDRHEEENGIVNLVKSGSRVDHFETVWRGKGKKPIDVSVTISAVKDSDGNIIGVSKIARDITERKASQKRIEYLAHYDPLTGLANRVLLADRMKTAIGNARRYSFRLAVLFVDLDRFKPINDSLGHEIGDKLLKTVAERMRSTVREADTVSRLGGDEFVVLLSRVHAASDAAHVAKNIIAALSQPYHIEGHELLLTASIGISIYPDSGKDANNLLRRADEAMYSAKGQGRNRYHACSAHD